MIATYMAGRAIGTSCIKRMDAERPGVLTKDDQRWDACVGAGWRAHRVMGMRRSMAHGMLSSLTHPGLRPSRRPLQDTWHRSGIISRRV